MDIIYQFAVIYGACALDDKEEQAIEHILLDYKRVLKEKEELRENYRCAQACANMVFDKIIPVQKIKDKIEEIQEDKDSKYYDMFLETRDIEYVVEILQELLKGRKI